MEHVELWQRLAEKWREAASEVSVPALKRCYAERAEGYERLAARNPSSGQFFAKPSKDG